MHSGRRWNGRKDMFATHVHNEFISIKLYAHRLVLIKKLKDYSSNGSWT